jgi:hypothetical protein
MTDLDGQERCVCGGYWQVFENGTFCKDCDKRKVTPLYLTDQPGGKRAVEHGCSCPTDQPGAFLNRFTADKDCPLHGLPIAKALTHD